MRKILLRVAAVAAGCDQASLEIGTELYQLLTLSLTQRRWLPRVRLEISNPNTPAHVQDAAPKIFTIGVGLNADEQRRKGIIPCLFWASP